MHFLYALVRKSSFSKAQGFVKPAPGHNNIVRCKLFTNPAQRAGFMTPSRLTNLYLSAYYRRQNALLLFVSQKVQFSKAPGCKLGLWLRLECSLDSLSIDSAHVIYVAEGHNVGAERQSSVMTLRKPIVTWII